jgi:hypothetical protein
MELRSHLLPMPLLLINMLLQLYKQHNGLQLIQLVLVVLFTLLILLPL